MTEPVITLDTAENAMVLALHAALGQAPDVTKAYAASEARKLAETLALITRQRETGEIDEVEAATALKLQAGASVAVLCTVKGMDRITAELAVNAAVDVIKSLIVKAAGSFF